MKLQMMVQKIIFIMGIYLGWTNVLLARDDREPYDLSLVGGFAFGSIDLESQWKSNPNLTKEESYRLNAIPFYMFFNFDLLEKISMKLGPGVLIDARNTLVLRQTLELGALFHVLGGSRHLLREGDAVSIVATSPWNLSLGIKNSLNNYGTRIETVEFSGSAFETKLGFEYRRDINLESAIGFEAYSTVLTLPAGVTRVRYRALEVLMVWRRYF